VADRTRFSNRLTALLKGYFPQVLDWFEDIRTIVVCDFLDSLAPDLSRAASQTINQFLRSHHSTSNSTNQRRLREIKAAVPLTTDTAVVTSSLLQVKALVAQLRTTMSAISEYDRHLEAPCLTHDDYELFAALPGLLSLSIISLPRQLPNLRLV
jgi:hypothetical protein